MNTQKLHEKAILYLSIIEKAKVRKENIRQTYESFSELISRSEMLKMNQRMKLMDEIVYRCCKAYERNLREIHNLSWNATYNS